MGEAQQLAEVERAVQRAIQQAVQRGNGFAALQGQYWHHNALNLGVFGLVLGLLAGIAWLGKGVNAGWYVPLAALGFGWGYFVLFILVVHEASHGLFIRLAQPVRSRFFNRLLGWGVCVPLGIDYLKHWEVGHRLHHRNPCRTGDPQNCPGTLFTGGALFRFVAKTLLVPGFIQFSGAGYHCPATEDYGRNAWLLFGQGIAWCGLAGWTLASGRWPVLLAAFLGLQVLAVFNLFKIAMEHGGAIALQENPQLRSSSSLFPLRWLVMPLNISLHFEHHLHPGVPWYRLMAYHRALQAQLPEAVRKQTLAVNGQVWQRICEPFLPVLPEGEI